MIEVEADKLAGCLNDLDIQLVLSFRISKCAVRKSAGYYQDPATKTLSVPRV